jgi:tripartite-type tricarboxylate transporter receptor subunit TctC
MNSNLVRLGAEANAGSPQDFAAFIADETTKWGAIIKASGVKLD